MNKIEAQTLIFLSNLDSSFNIHTIEGRTHRSGGLARSPLRSDPAC